MRQLQRCWATAFPALVVVFVVTTLLQQLNGQETTAIPGADAVSGCRTQCRAQNDSGQPLVQNALCSMNSCTLELPDAPEIFPLNNLRAWLPRESLPSNYSYSLLLSDVTLVTSSCAPVWALQSDACTFRVSSSWPNTGLQVGAGFVFFPFVSNAQQPAAAVRLNVTCPPADWAALAAAQPSALLPCGTATVSTWDELAAALTGLQISHSRVLITLTRNISAPADPAARSTGTCGSADDGDGGDGHTADMSQPLVVIYRNTTLVGLGAPGSNSSATMTAGIFSSSGSNGVNSTSGTTPGGGGHGSSKLQQRQTELNLSCRRNIFLLQQPESAIATASGGSRSRRLVMTFADLAVVNVPVGPRNTWPIGLTTGMWHVGMNRSEGAPVQLIYLRLTLVLSTGQTQYFGYWYNKAVSPVHDERPQAAWLLDIMAPAVTFQSSDDGSTVSLLLVGSFLEKYNTTATSVPVLNNPTPPPMDLWSLDDQHPIAPSAVAFVADAEELAEELNQLWVGPRVIVLLADVTLDAATWPKDGIQLTSAVTISGPCACSASASASSPSASSPSPSISSLPPLSSSSSPTQQQRSQQEAQLPALNMHGLTLARMPPDTPLIFRNLRLRNLSVPIAWALPGVPVSLRGLPAYDLWMSGCLMPAGMAVRGTYVIYGCNVEVPPDVFALLQVYNNLPCNQVSGATGSSSDLAVNCTSPAASAAAAAALFHYLPTDLNSLFERLFRATGRLAVLQPDADTLLFRDNILTTFIFKSTVFQRIRHGTHGSSDNMTSSTSLNDLVDTGAGSAGSRAGSPAGSSGVGADTLPTTCTLPTLLTILMSAPAAAPSVATRAFNNPAAPSQAARTGGIMAGAVVGAIVVCVVIVLVVRWRAHQGGWPSQQACPPDSVKASATGTDEYDELHGSTTRVGDCGGPHGLAGSRQQHRHREMSGPGSSGADRDDMATDGQKVQAAFKLLKGLAYTRSSARIGPGAPAGGSSSSSCKGAGCCLAVAMGRSSGRAVPVSSGSGMERDQSVVLRGSGAAAVAIAITAGYGGVRGEGGAGNASGGAALNASRPVADFRTLENSRAPGRPGLGHHGGGLAASDGSAEGIGGSAFSRSFTAADQEGSRKVPTMLEQALAKAADRGKPRQQQTPWKQRGQLPLQEEAKRKQLQEKRQRQQRQLMAAVLHAGANGVGSALGAGAQQSPATGGRGLDASGLPVIGRGLHTNTFETTAHNNSDTFNGQPDGHANDSCPRATPGGSSLGGNVQRALAGEIDDMIRRFEQATSNQVGNQPSGQRPQVLGRGGFGVVYKGEWQGLPVAIKVVLMQDGDSAARRERLVREIALSATLSHPNVVPTYHYTVQPVAASSGAHSFLGLGAPCQTTRPQPRDAPGGGDEGDAADALAAGAAGHVMAYKLSIFMAYCDRGTLQNSLRGGFFRRPWALPPVPVGSELLPPVPLAPPQSPQQLTYPGTAAALKMAMTSKRQQRQAREGAGGSNCCDSSTPPAAAAAAARSDKGGGDDIVCGSNGDDTVSGGGLAFSNGTGCDAAGAAPYAPAAPQPWQRGLSYHLQQSPQRGTSWQVRPGVLNIRVLLQRPLPALSPEGPDGVAVPPPAAAAAIESPRLSRPPGAGGGSGATWEPRLECWQDLRAAANQALALFAALDVARGLDYLHSCNVIHGDLSLQNILLASTAPLFSDATVSASASASAVPNSTAGPVTTGSCSGGGGGGGARGGCGSGNGPRAFAVMESLPEEAIGVAAAVAADATATSAAPPPCSQSPMLAGAMYGAAAAGAAAAGASLVRGFGDAATDGGEIAGGGGIADAASSASDPEIDVLVTSTCTQSGTLGGFSTNVMEEMTAMAASASASAARQGMSIARRLALVQPLLCQVFKISDFGLSVRLEGDETHLSGLHQGTPYYTATEVLMSGRLSPAADIYSFGVCLWCLVHGVSLCQLRHLLPPIFAPAAPTLLAHLAPDLLPGVRSLLCRCLAGDSARRPSAGAIVAELQSLMQAVMGPELAPLLLGAERREAETGRIVAGSLTLDSSNSLAAKRHTTY